MAAREERSSAYKSLIKLPAAIGDWTTYKPPRAGVKKVKLGLYSFDRLSQEELKLGHKIHYNLARLLIKGLKSKINVGAELHTVSCEQSSYANFIKQIIQPVTHLTLSIPKISGNVNVLIDLSLADTLINQALGSTDTTPQMRKLTEIEERTLGTVMGEFSKNYVQAFEGVIEAPNLKITSSPEMTIDETIVPTNSFIFFTCEISLSDNPPSKIIIGYTAETLKTLLKKYEMAAESKSPNFMKIPEGILGSIYVPVTGYLGQTNIPTQDLKTLETGDVVALDTTLEDLMSLILGANVQLTGRAGIKDGKLSIRILGLGRRGLEEKVEKIDETPGGMPKEEAKEEELPLEKSKEEEYPIEEEEDLEEELLEEEFPEEKGEM